MGHRDIRADGDGGNGFYLGHEPALDGIRGISILAVMGFNAHLQWLQGGFIGVDIFFVLSGFLITALLVQGYDQHAGLRIKSFYFRRALRLFPALLLLVACCLAYAWLLQPPDKAANTTHGVFFTLLYVANWAQVPPFLPGIGPLSHTWSLSVEEQFYIIWPAFLLLMLRLKSRGLIACIFAVAIAASVLLNVWLWFSGTPFLRMYFGTDTRANEILIGCVAAFALYWKVILPTERTRRVLHAVAIVSLSGILASFFLVSHFGPFVYNGGFALISIGTAALIVDLVIFPSRFSQLLGCAPLAWIGKISYGLYLWHFPVFEAVRRLEGSVSPVVYHVAGFAAAFSLASMSFYFIERPFLKLKSRFEPPTNTNVPPTHRWLAEGA